MFRRLCFLKLLIQVERFYLSRNVLHLDAFLALLKSWLSAAYFWHALLNTYSCFHWHCEQTSLDFVNHSCTVNFILRSAFDMFRWISSFTDTVNERFLNIVNHSCSSVNFILQSAFDMFCWISVHTYTVNKRLLDIVNHSYTV